LHCLLNPAVKEMAREMLGEAPVRPTRAINLACTMIISVPTITSRNTRPRRRSAEPAPAIAPEEPVITNVSGREAVSAAKLISFINTEVQSRPECGGVKVRGGAWEVDRYADDCNWSETSLVVHVSGTVCAGAFEELRKVIARARERFDVVAPEAYLL
jgi:hypothetical protein